ncbi:MarR family winged helix-turn-helix transcriptional regulator [Streptomyces sp. PT12]|uniref:MarR family winged helix-turn-helix transcriptional regulator n=1 Tax=Streptomyces sp. PT12 TaxID=1510197 RepID=UPI0015EF5754|nr:MarR family transcriptional regulator [Streptomyces sp. PT12]
MVMLSRQQEQDLGLWRNLFKLSSYVAQTLERRLMRSHGIGLTDYMALDAMREREPKSYRMQELADELGVNQSTLSRVATRLEKGALVERYTSEHDRRCTMIRLTDTGRERLGEYTDTFNAELHTALEMAAVSPDLAPLLIKIRS